MGDNDLSHPNMTPKLSICMVSLDCWDVLEPCLRSIYACEPPVDFEITIVDNGSRDATVARVREAYPAIRVIENGRNVGFTKGTNQAITASSGQYLLWLNTDTVLRPDSLHQLCDFLDRHPRAGIVGPKVLNADGTFQPQCKRGMPTPFASFAYFSKISRLFPGDPRFGQYLLSFLPEDETNQVTAVSGCCLLARREMWDQIGPLDEDIFSYGEDIDWCVRAARAGWQVWFYPRSQIVHLKGRGGAHSRPYRKAWGMHKGMWVFYRKHLKQRYPPVTNALVWLGIRIGLGLSYARIAVRQALMALAGGPKRLRLNQ